MTLNDTIAFNAARIAAPDRIYFDLHRAKLTPDIAKKNWEVKDGLLKSLRLGQNKDGVVRAGVGCERSARLFRVICWRIRTGW